MDNNYIRNSFRILSVVLLAGIFYSCANIGSPNGGPYDEAPPKYVSSTPVPNQKNYKGKKIEILFDELIQIDKPSENVIITPPQLQQPVIRSSGRKAVIELKDSLKDNTTYTIDFTNSISDNNEKNVYENFSFAFSTGDVIDTMEVSGILLNAENLEPMPGITIGLHSNLADSAFQTLPFDRTSRTNDKGQFTIRNIAPGTYHIFALNDVNRDYKFDQAGEDIAFLDTLIIPSLELTSRQDTLWKDSLTIDTIRTVEYIHYFPDDIELRLFKEKFARQYMLKPERPDQKYFSLRFNAPVDTVPVPVPLNFEPQDSSWFFVNKQEGGTQINYWLTDSLIWKQDTLSFEVTYPKSDSLNIPRPQTDTVQVVMRHRPEKKKKKDEPILPVPLGMDIKASGSINLYDTLSVTFTEPVKAVDKELFYLDQKVDTLWQPVSFEMFPDTTNSLKYYIQRPWKYGEEYRLTIDSATIESIYDKWNDPYSGTFKIKGEDEYGHFYLNVTGIEKPAFVELLTSADTPVRKAKVKDGGALFMDLKPDKYYARIIIDDNNNGVWDTGNYAEKKQPEMVYYSPKVYNIPQNWQVEETWNLNDTPLSKQKPLEITKNKPKEATKKKRDYKDEGKKSSSRSSSGVQGMPF